MTESDLFAVSEDGDLLVHLDDEGLLPALGGLVARVRAHLRSGGRRVVIDCDGLTRMSSTTLAALLLAKRHCRAAGAQLSVLPVSPAVALVVRRAGLTELTQPPKSLEPVR
jgi:anti-anti-sigma factor